MAEKRILEWNKEEKKQFIPFCQCGNMMKPKNFLGFCFCEKIVHITQKYVMLEGNYYCDWECVKRWIREKYRIFES